MFSRKIGWYPANLGVRFWSAASFCALAVLRKKRISQLLTKIPAIIYLISGLDVIVFIIFNLGLIKAEPAVVSTISSGSTLVSVILASLFLKDKTAFSQKAGILLCLGGITSLSMA